MDLLRLPKENLPTERICGTPPQTKTTGSNTGKVPATQGTEIMHNKPNRKHSRMQPAKSSLTPSVPVSRGIQTWEFGTA
ncbi:MAG TPA: hypothetical protein O0X98_06250 [Methanocorpusculum sp.]|nr:hypothetical protein [Methanocorpusculum sp.]